MAKKYALPRCGELKTAHSWSESRFILFSVYTTDYKAISTFYDENLNVTNAGRAFRGEGLTAFGRATTCQP
jgi:hypothetical protein